MSNQLTPDPRGRYLPGTPIEPMNGGRPGADYLDYAPVDETVDLKEVVAVLRRHARMILGVAFACAAIVAGWVFTRPPEYEASALLRLKDVRSAMTAGLGDATALQGALLGRMTDPLLSELEILRSPAVAQEVIDREGLRLAVPHHAIPDRLIAGVQVDSMFPADTLRLELGASRYTVAGRSGSVTAAYGQAAVFPGLSFTLLGQPDDVAEEELIVLSREKAMETFLENLQAQPRDQTDVIDVRYVAGDPARAQRVVNSTVEVFQSVNTSMAQQQSRRRRTFIEEQLVRTDSMLADAQLQMSIFREREQVYSTGQRFAAEQQTLMELELERESLAAEQRMFEGLLDRVEASDGDVDGLRTLVSSPAIAANPVVAQLFTRLLQYQTALDSMTTGRFGASDRNPDVQRVTNLIGTTRSDLTAAARSHSRSVGARITAIDQMRGRAATQMETLPSTEAEEVRLAIQLETVKEIADQLREEYQRARVAEVVEAGQVEVLALAQAPEEPVEDMGGLKVMLGLMVGLMLGGGGAFLREHMDTTLSRKDDVEEALRVPALGIIPHLMPATGHVTTKRRSLRWILPIGKTKKGAEVRLITAANANSSGAEAYRSLRTNLLFSQVVRSLKSIVITSCSPGEGKTTTAVNLAIAYAQQDKRVLLIDCDMRRPRVHKVLGLPLEPGLSQLAVETSTSMDAIKATMISGLFAVTAGIQPPNPSEILGSERLRLILERLSTGFDLIILDTPPVLAAADASVLAARSDGVLMVIRAGRTERTAAQHAAQQLDAVGARVLGAVLNDPDSTMRANSGYYQNEQYYGGRTVASA